MNGTIRSETLDRVQRWALLCAGIGIVLCLIALLVRGWRTELLQSYLWSYLFFLGITLGSGAIMMLHNVTGGAWGVVIRQFLMSASRLIPWMAILFVPLLLGVSLLYPWARPSEVAGDRILEHKAAYLNLPFWLARFAGYFVIWIAIIFVIQNWLMRQDVRPDYQRGRMIQRWSGIGLLLYGLTMTFASVDWVMSLEKHWFSTIFGFLFIVGQVLSTIAFVIVVVAILHARRPLSDLVTRGHFHDLGNLLLTFVVLWAYIGFSQYLIIWSGNLPEEVPWYIRRNTGSLRVVAIALIVLHFCVPFVLLLVRKTKQEIATLAAVAVGIIIMRMIDLFWIVTPSFNRDGWMIKWTDVAAPLAIGGIWVALYVWQLRGRTLLLRASEDLEAMHHA